MLLISPQTVSAITLAVLGFVVLANSAMAQGTIPPEALPYLDQYYEHQQSLIDEAARASEVDLSVADEVLVRFEGVLNTMAESVGLRAKQLLLILFTLDLVLSIGRSLQGQESFAGMLQRLVTRVSFVTLVALFIDNAASFTTWLAQVSVKLGNEAMGASGDEIKPSVSSIFAQAWRLAWEMIREISIWKPVSVLYILTAFFVLIIAGIMIALLMTVYIELYMVALAGLIVLGFAGLETSKDSFATYVRTLIGKAFKILGLLIIFAMMTNVVNEVAGSSSSSLGIELVLLILVLQIVTVVLLMTVPSSLEALAGGVGASRAAEVIAGAVTMMAALPLAKVGAGAALGSISGSMQGAAAGIAGAAGQGAGAMAKAAAKGAMSGGGKTAARYAAAGGMRGRSLRGAMAKDFASLMKKEGRQ